MSKEMLCHMPEALVSINTCTKGALLRLTGGNNILKTPPTVKGETPNEEKWEKLVWNFHCPKPSLYTDAQLSQCSWPNDKWEKIVQFEMVVSSRGRAFQINERLSRVWQKIFLKHSWEIGPYHGKPLAMPSIRQARHYSRGDLVELLLMGFLFLHSPSQASWPPPSLFSNPYLKRQCSFFYIINLPLSLRSCTMTQMTIETEPWKKKWCCFFSLCWIHAERWTEPLRGSAQSNTFSKCLDFHSPLCCSYASLPVLFCVFGCL